MSGDSESDWKLISNLLWLFKTGVFRFFLFVAVAFGPEIIDDELLFWAEFNTAESSLFGRALGGTLAGIIAGLEAHFDDDDDSLLTTLFLVQLLLL